MSSQAFDLAAPWYCVDLWNAQFESESSIQVNVTAESSTQKSVIAESSIQMNVTAECSIQINVTAESSVQMNVTAESSVPIFSHVQESKCKTPHLSAAPKSLGEVLYCHFEEASLHRSDITSLLVYSLGQVAWAGS